MNLGISECHASTLPPSCDLLLLDTNMGPNYSFHWSLPGFSKLQTFEEFGVKRREF